MPLKQSLFRVNVIVSFPSGVQRFAVSSCVSEAAPALPTNAHAEPDIVGHFLLHSRYPCIFSTSLSVTKGTPICDRRDKLTTSRE